MRFNMAHRPRSSGVVHYYQLLLFAVFLPSVLSDLDTTADNLGISCSDYSLTVSDQCGTADNDSSTENCGTNGLCGGFGAACTSNYACLSGICDSGYCYWDTSQYDQTLPCKPMGLTPYVEAHMQSCDATLVFIISFDLVVTLVARVSTGVPNRT